MLREMRAAGETGEMMFALRADLLRNLGNLTNVGRSIDEEPVAVPPLITEYSDEVRAQLRLVVRETGLPLEDKLAFLQETRHCFGRTALLLSGGGTLGVFHLGVVKELVRQKLLPRVIAGSSVGSVVGAIAATCTPDELENIFTEEHFHEVLPTLCFFKSQSLTSMLSHLLRIGTLQDVSYFQRNMRALLGDVTFQEAYDRSGGRILNVCVSPTRSGEDPRLLNYLTAPHVVVWSAVAASCAFPYLFPPQPLLAKSSHGTLVPFQPEGKLGARRWRDGSLEDDLPMRSLSELFNVNYFIVSQVNPHIVPLLRVKRAMCSIGGVGHTLAMLVETEWKHRCKQLLSVAPWLDFMSFAALTSQQWEGDVTIVMPYTQKQLANIVKNPDIETLRSYTHQGEREVWAKVATLRSNCGIELELDDCVRELRNQLRHHAVPIGRRGRVPSWNTITFSSRESYSCMPRSASGSSLGHGDSHGSLSDDGEPDIGIPPDALVAAAAG